MEESHRQKKGVGRQMGRGGKEGREVRRERREVKVWRKVMDEGGALRRGKQDRRERGKTKDMEKLERTRNES